MERLEVIKKLKKACLTEKRVNWFNTRMLNLVNKLGLLDGEFKAVSIDLTLSNPIATLHNNDGKLRTQRYSFQELLAMEKIGIEGLRITNKEW